MGLTRQERARITNVAQGSLGYGDYKDWIAHTQLEEWSGSLKR